MNEKIKKLLDELAAVVAELNALMEQEAPAEEGEGNEEANAQAVEDNERAIKELTERADAIKAKIEFCEKVAEKEKELRSVLERATPATPSVEPVAQEEPQVEERKISAIPTGNQNLQAFKGEGANERAYRAGMFLKGHCLGDSEARRWCADHGVEARANAGGIDASGGYLVPDILANEIIRLVEEFGAFPQYARRVPMTSDTLLIARRTGGLTAQAVGENTQVTDTDMTFDNVTLNAKIWGVANRTSNSLFEDSVINLADQLAVETAQAFAEAFDNAGFIGDGTSSYHSVTGVCTKVIDGNHTASVYTAPTGNIGFGTLDLDDFTATVAKLPLYAKRNAAWYISPVGYGQAMLRLAMAAGGNAQADVAGGFAERFLGYPVRLVHSMEGGLSGTEDSVLALFGDLSQAATFGERRAVSIRTASERYIEFDQTLTFATTRNAMVVHDLGSTSKAGPIVALQAAAS